MSYDGLVNIMRREAQNVYQAFNLPTTFGSVTAYNPKTHAVKVILHPTGIESGWIPLGTQHATNNGGVAVGPKVGSADALDGDQVLVAFMGNDPNSPVVTQRFYSDSDPPPLVQPGEVVVQHSSGTRVFLDQDGQLIHEHGPSGNTITLAKDNSITLTHKATGSTIQIDKDGNHVHDTKGKGLTIKADTLAFEGNATLNGLPIKTGA